MEGPRLDYNYDSVDFPTGFVGTLPPEEDGQGHQDQKHEEDRGQEDEPVEGHQTSSSSGLWLPVNHGLHSGPAPGLGGLLEALQEDGLGIRRMAG